MKITGYENLNATEITSLLMGEGIPPGDVEGLHGAVILLCKRVAELEDVLSSHTKLLENITGRKPLYY